MPEPCASPLASGSINLNWYFAGEPSSQGGSPFPKCDVAARGRPGACHRRTRESFARLVAEPCPSIGPAGRRARVGRSSPDPGPVCGASIVQARRGRSARTPLIPSVARRTYVRNRALSKTPRNCNNRSDVVRPGATEAVSAPLTPEGARRHRISCPAAVYALSTGDQLFPIGLWRPFTTSRETALDDVPEVQPDRKEINGVLGRDETASLSQPAEHARPRVPYRARRSSTCNRRSTNFPPSLIASLLIP